MATFKSLHLLFMFISNYSHLTVQANTVSLSFPLRVARLSGKTTYKPNLFPSSNKSRRFDQKNAVAPVVYRSFFSYSSMIIIVPIPFGTPPQPQQMVLDTGSQLSWFQCDQKTKNKNSTFKTRLSTSFSRVPCKNPACPVRDVSSLGRRCEKKDGTCHFSIFYADGTQAEGNLVREKVNVSTLSLIVGCSETMDSSGAQGILGMNLGQLSFISQINVSKFSYCVPANNNNNNNNNLKGTFYLGHNPNSHSFQYINILTYPKRKTQGMPNFDPLAYTVGLLAITMGGKRLNIPQKTFIADSGGSGQTILDSGTKYTYLVEDAYVKVKDYVANVTIGKKGKFLQNDPFEMCFRDNPKAIGKMIGDIGRKIGGMVFHFERGVDISIDGERTLVNMGRGVICFAIINSTPLEIAGNMIGNFHQQNHWVEYDVTNKLVGIGRADCSKSK